MQTVHIRGDFLWIKPVSNGQMSSKIDSQQNIPLLINFIITFRRLPVATRKKVDFLARIFEIVCKKQINRPRDAIVSPKNSI